MPKQISSFLRRFFRNLDDVKFTKLQYFYRQGRPLDLENPKSLNEKLQWLKLNYRHPLAYECANKLTVRPFVAAEAGDQYLVPVYQVIKNVSDLRFSDLPDQFIAKTAHASGGVFACYDKKNTTAAHMEGLIRKWLAVDFFEVGREWMYLDSPRAVMVERLLDANTKTTPKDYKFFCFHGEPRMIQVDHARFSDHKRTLYDMDWKALPFRLVYGKGPDESGCPPRRFKEMCDLARKLSKPFPFVRVDLYEAEDRVWFGELTFCPGKGVERFKPYAWDVRLGEMLDLKRIEEK